MGCLKLRIGGGRGHRRRYADAVGYLGRAESWTECAALAEWDGAVNCRPLDGRADGDPVRLPGPHNPATYAAERLRIMHDMKRQDGDGWIDHVSVFIAGGMNDSVRGALDRITRLWLAPKHREQDDAPELGSVKEWRLALEGFGRPSDFAGGPRIFGTSRRWRSVTPFLASGHLKASGYAGEFRRLLKRRGLQLAHCESMNTGGREAWPVEALPTWRRLLWSRVPPQTQRYYPSQSNGPRAGGGAWLPCRKREGARYKPRRRDRGRGLGASEQSEQGPGRGGLGAPGPSRQ